MNNTAKRFYKLAEKYERAATFLWLQIAFDPDMINPTVYLLRHSVELYLKGLVIEKEFQNNLCTEIERIKIKGSGKAKPITSEHSLLNLWSYYKHLSKTYRLTPSYSPEDQRSIDSEIAYWNAKDPGSTSYRYPFERDGKPIPIKLLCLDDSGKTPEVKCTPPKAMVFGTNVCIVEKGYNCLVHTQKLFDVAEKLSRLFEQ